MKLSKDSTDILVHTLPHFERVIKTLTAELSKQKKQDGDCLRLDSEIRSLNNHIVYLKSLL